MRGKQILKRMATVYATCTSYCDTGVVSTLFIEAKGTRTVEKPFTTAFVRPDRFRFEYREGSHRHLVWRDGQEVRTQWLKPGIEKAMAVLLARSPYRNLVRPESLELALAGMTGVSGGSAHTIPALLLPEEVGGRRLTDMTEVKRIEDALSEEGGVECYQVLGKYAGHPIVLWIEKSTFCLWRMETQHPFEHFRTEKTTTYFPLVNREAMALHLLLA